MSAQKRAKENSSTNVNRRPPVASNSPRLIAALPESPTGQRLANLFPNQWQWIHSYAPALDAKPEWETIRRYPITPIELFSYHQDPNNLIGIRPDQTTQWAVIDIDRPSKYHPATNPAALDTIHNALEGIGITRTLINQSSHSGGLHIYIPLPEAINSYALSITLKYHLEAAGIEIRSGQCETFPNPKRYVPKGEGHSQYNGIRLPMQPESGFIPLDTDLTPLPLTLEGWLDRFELCAAQQDLPRLHRQIEDAQLNRRSRSKRDPESLDTWRDRIDQEKTQGWTGPGQTNEKLKLFGCEARVFLRMDSIAQIAQHIEETARNTPGFYQHSTHTEDLRQRSQEIAQWAHRYYWPLGGTPSRDTSYRSPILPVEAVASFSYHQTKREAAQHRIKEAMSQLIEQNTLSPSPTERAQQIIKLGNVSQKTLYRSFNKPLWHPAHLPIEERTETEEQAETETEQVIFQPEPKTEKNVLPEAPEPPSTEEIFHPLKYEGFDIQNQPHEAAAALTPQKGQKAAKAALAESDHPEKGGLGGKNALPVVPASQTPIAPPSKWRNLRANLPEAFQSKIAQAERQRTRAQERETHRRQRAETMQQQRTLAHHPAPSPCKISPPAAFETPPARPLLTPFVEPIPPLEPYQRPPTRVEQEEFETWYTLAEQFKLVSDHHWEDSEYWVESNGQWHPYCELSGTFTVRRLEQYLGKTPHSESSISKGSTHEREKIVR